LCETGGMGAGPSGGMDQAFDVVIYRARISKMTDEELIEEGAYYRKVVGYGLKPMIRGLK
jgi:hypothetical protein